MRPSSIKEEPADLQQALEDAEAIAKRLCARYIDVNLTVFEGCTGLFDAFLTDGVLSKEDGERIRRSKFRSFTRREVRPESRPFWIVIRRHGGLRNLAVRFDDWGKVVERKREGDEPLSEDAPGAWLQVRTPLDPEPEVEDEGACGYRYESEPITMDGRKGTLNRTRYRNGRVAWETREFESESTSIRWDSQGHKLDEHRRNQRGYWDGKRSTWYRNGQMSSEATYADGKPQGEERVWYPNGQLKGVMDHRMGVLRTGPFRAWHPNGRKWCEGEFHDGWPEGKWEIWDTDGKLVETRVYANERIAQTPPPPRTPFEYPGELGAADFGLTIMQGGVHEGRGRPTILRISAAGNCELYFDKSYCAVFRLTPAMQRAVRDAVREVDLFSLNDRYIHPSIQDGDCWQVTIRAGGKTKSSYCENYYPKAARELVAFVAQSILPHFQAEMMAARQSSPPARSLLLDDPKP